jgi:RHS repeat-associated protein
MLDRRAWVATCGFVAVALVVASWAGCSGSEQSSSVGLGGAGGVLPGVEPAAAATTQSPLDVVLRTEPFAHGLLRTVELERIGSQIVPRTSSGNALRFVTAAPTAASGPIHIGSARPADEDVWLEVKPLGRSDAEAQIEHGAVVYKDVAPLTDVVVVIGLERIEELRVLRGPEALAEARYQLRQGDGIRGLRDRAGVIEALDDSGRVAFRTEPAEAIDAAGRTRDVSVRLDGRMLVVSFDPTGLDYPVVVDPAWTYGASWPSQAVVALNSVLLGTKSEVTGDVAVVDASAGPVLGDGAELSMQPSALVTGDVAADTIGLKNKAKVTGDAAFNQLVQQQHAVIGGAKLTPLALPLPLEVPALPSITPGSSDVVVATGGELVLAAGAYRNVQVPAAGQSHPSRLRLAGGSYQVSSLSIGSHGRVECADACELLVKGRVAADEGAYLGPADGSGLTAPDVELLVAGINGQTGELGATPRAAAVGPHGSLVARLLVPNGTATFGEGTSVTGRLVARDIDLGPQVTVVKDEGAAEPDCEGYCQKVIAAGCPNGPTDQASCEAACQASTTTGDCTEQWSAVVVCAVASGTVTCDGSGKPTVSGCPTESADLTECETVCAGTDDDNPCTLEACNCPLANCDPQTAITHTPVAPGTSCSDGNVCNGSEICNGAGTCVAGTLLVIDDGNPCTTDTCDPLAGVSHVPAPVGTGCGDGNACNGDEVCDAAGICQPGAPPPLDDGNPCTVDTCAPATGVHHTPVAAGTACPDGNLCNGDETCDDSGTCRPGTPPTLDDGNPCTVDACDPATGVHHMPAASGTPCPDGNACNGDEKCDAAGHCQPGTTPVLDDGNPCTADSCDPATGVHHVPLGPGTPCPDGNVCNGAETCNGAGICAPGTPRVVDDGNPCTIDSCDPATGVTHVAAAAGTPCPNGDLCDGDELCNGAGISVAGTPPAVDDGNPCTADTCDPALGVLHLPLALGTGCSDGNVCNGVETCDGVGTCVAGVPPSLDDGNPCTIDACDRVTGVTHVLAGSAGTECGAGMVCDDSGACIALPADPALHAPAVDRSVPSTVATTTAFLYTGPDAVQSGVVPGTIAPERAAVVRGAVQTREGTALGGVFVTVRDHPEFGHTLSRADGGFDLAVNGGAILALQFRRGGYLTAERRVDVPWQDYAQLGLVALVPLDPRVTDVDFSAPITAARGSVATDTDGTRQATLLFPQGTTADMVLPNGSVVPLPTLSVRLTEYTMGDHGPLAMPQLLPPSSQYTYAVELSADEALAAGATKVRLSQPVPLYVENFLGFPTGSAVPVGRYDREADCWAPQTNGRIVEVLALANGLAELDIDGTGLAADAAALAALGITNAERQELAVLYSPGQTLWRVPVRSFSPWDCNWPGGPPPGAPAPGAAGAGPLAGGPGGASQPNCESEGGSTIECQAQTLGESVALIGTPFSLQYESDRVPGRRAAYSLAVQLVGASVPVGLERIEYQVSVAGQVQSETFAPQPGQVVSFVWNGEDVYGRPLQGSSAATISIGYVYAAHYYASSAQFERAFGAYSGTPGVSLTGNRARSEVTIWQEWVRPVGPWDATASGLGGWSLSEHHSYDPEAQVIYEGNGRRRTAEAVKYIIETRAGNGEQGYYNDPAQVAGTPATSVGLAYPQGVAFAPDGTLYFADTSHHMVWRVGKDGLLQHVAGGANGCAPATLGDGGPATSACLGAIFGIALAPDGSLYIADVNDFRIRRVRPDGIIETVAGTGAYGNTGDGGPALQTAIYPYRLAVAPNGTVYFFQSQDVRVWRLSCDGLVLPVAGTGQPRYAGDPSGDGGPALAAKLGAINDVAVGPDGSLYFLDMYDSRVRKVGPDGILTSVAATVGTLNNPKGIDVGPDGQLYIADFQHSQIRVVGAGGALTTIAGTGAGAFSGDGGPGRAAALRPTDIAIGPGGMIAIADTYNQRVRVLRPPYMQYDGSAYLVPSEDGAQAYQFSPTGRHVRTVDALTGATLLEFGYDDQGRLATVRDGDDNLTTIERDLAGAPAAVVGPYGQRTSLSVDANGYLATATEPAGGLESFTYSTDGLILSHADANGRASSYEYDALGRLTRDTAPDGFSLAFSRTETADGFTVQKTSAMGRTSSYQVRTLSDGTEQRTNIFPSGRQATERYSPDGTTLTTLPEGRTISSARAPDPRFGMLAPVTATATTRTPAGKTLTATATRTVTLSDPHDMLSVASLTDTRVVNGKTTTRLFTGSSRTLRTTTPVGRQATSTLDTKGRVVQSNLDSLLATAFSYDAQGRLAGMTRGVRGWSRTYDALGWLHSASDPLSQVTVYERDAAGRLLVETRPDGASVGWGYDAKGSVVSLTPPGRTAHLFEYTAGDQRSDYEPPDAGFNPRDTSWAYNLDRQPDLETRPNGVTLDQQYDSAGRLIRITTPEGAVTRTYSATTGLLSSVTTPSGVTLTYGYDGNLLTLASWSGPFSASVGFDYDNDFRVVTERVKAANPLSFGYDNDSLVTQAGSLGLTYEPLTGFLSTTTLGLVHDARTYSTYGEAATYQATVSGSPVYSVSYVRDGLGRISEKTETVDGDTTTYHYTYDLAGRLVEVERDGVLASEYSYDDNGNRVGATIDGASVMGTYDAQDRLVQYGDYTYDFNADGELATRTKTATSETNTFVYDAFGNLRRVTPPSSTVIDYLVDGQNRRVLKKVGGVAVKGFVYRDSLRPIAELDGAGNVVSRFVYGTGRNVPDYMVKGGSTYRIITDHLGSVRLVVNATTGEIAQEMSYDEFGRVLSDTNPGFQPFGFAGGLYDPDTGLVRFGARDYDAETGRWTAKDSSLFDGRDPNLYEYAFGDPVNFVDWTGAEPSSYGECTWLEKEELDDCVKRCWGPTDDVCWLFHHKDVARCVRKCVEGYLWRLRSCDILL